MHDGSAMSARRSAPAAAWHGSAAQDNGQVIEVDPGRFEEMVGTALDGLPEELGQLMRNVAVTVEHGAGPPGLLGLYEGIPLTSRTSQYAGVLPDHIIKALRPDDHAVQGTKAEDDPLPKILEILGAQSKTKTAA